MWYDDGVLSQRSTMPDTVIPRFTFIPDRASAFSDAGRAVVELALGSIYEVQEFPAQFNDALIDVTAIVNGQVVSLSDFAGTN